MRFLFDCEDEICLPAAYRLVDEVKPFIDKMKAVEVGSGMRLSCGKYCVVVWPLASKLTS